MTTGDLDPPAHADEIERAFNEWMRRYIDDPESHERGMSTVQTYLAELNIDEVEPSYGKVCCAYLRELIHQERAGTTIAPLGDAPEAPAADPGADIPEPQEN